MSTSKQEPQKSKKWEMPKKGQEQPPKLQQPRQAAPSPPRRHLPTERQYEAEPRASLPSPTALASPPRKHAEPLPQPTRERPPPAAAKPREQQPQGWPPVPTTWSEMQKPESAKTATRHLCRPPAAQQAAQAEVKQAPPDLKQTRWQPKKESKPKVRQARQETRSTRVEREPPMARRRQGALPPTSPPAPTSLSCHAPDRS